MYHNTSKQLAHPQRGMTMISWLVVIGFLIFQGILALNVVPVYLTDSSVASSMKSLGSDQTLNDANPARIRETLMKRLKINNVYDMKPEAIKIKKAKGGYLVSIEYEPRGKLVGSLDFIVTFKHEALVASSTAE
jgi:hypothetical protein